VADMRNFLQTRPGQLPGLMTIRAFLAASGIDDPDVIGMWLQAWQRINLAETDKRHKRPQSSLRPDPLGARTPAQLVASLRAYRQWAGEPSFRRMAAQAHQRVAASTMCNALRGHDLPRVEIAVAIIAGCGGGEEDQQRYATAWRQIKLSLTASPSRPAMSRQVNLRKVS
jgi:hypothetical protein